MARGNPHPRKEWQFKKGNPGKIPGTKNKATLLKEKIFSAALSIDLKGSRNTVSALGKALKIPNIRPDDLIRVAAGLIPKEQLIKGEGFETNVTLANVLGGGEVAPEVRRELIACLRKRGSSEQSV